ncbi:RHOMBOID-like protein 12, mitochondrial isoform X1 [Carex rostrata]
MTRRLFASHLRRLLNPATRPNPKPFSSPTSQQNHLSQSHFLSWQSKPNRSLYFSTYKPRGRQFLSQSSKTLPVMRFLTHGARSLSFSLQRRGGLGQIISSMRRFWSYQIMTPDGVVLFLVGANVAVFILWGIADPSFMRKNFMISLDNFKSGRLHTLITSAFSHSAVDHLVTNMIGLYFFGRSIAELFGPNFLLKLYLGGALCGSIFFLVNRAFLDPSNRGYRGWDSSRVPALGASAAVNAIILLEVFLFPKRLVYLYLLIPVPAAFLGAALIGTDLWRVQKGQDHVSGAAHLGGALVAAIVWARLRKRI